MKVNYNRWYITLLSLLLIVALAGCLKTAIRYSVVKNVNHKSLNTTSGMTLAEAGQLIQAAGVERNWTMNMKEPGHIIGFILVRSKHRAVVDINYTTKSFSIDYKDSSNLGYNPGTGRINKSYNNWVYNLEKAILIKLTGNSEKIEADEWEDD